MGPELKFGILGSGKGRSSIHVDCRFPVAVRIFLAILAALQLRFSDYKAGLGFSITVVLGIRLRVKLVK